MIKDLGRPDRFLYVLLRPQWKSWLSRGAYIITVYGAILTAWLIASFGGFYEYLPILEALGLVFAFLSAVYTAFLFAQAKGRDLWQSPMLGVHMILHSIMAGLARDGDHLVHSCAASGDARDRNGHTSRNGRRSQDGEDDSCR